MEPGNSSTNLPIDYKFIALVANVEYVKCINSSI